MSRIHKYVFLFLQSVILAFFIVDCVKKGVFDRDGGYFPNSTVLYLLTIIATIVLCVFIVLPKSKPFLFLLSPLPTHFVLGVSTMWPNVIVGVNIFTADWVLRDITWLLSFLIIGYAIFLFIKSIGRKSVGSDG